MQRKGFTLFTALVSFILMVLTTLIVGNMVATASNTAQIVASLEEQTKMQAIADLARADALQVFNYYVRYKIENYFISPADNNYISENWISVKGTDWEEIKEDFIRDYFEDPGKDKHPFAEVMASAIQIILGRGDYPVRGYSVKLIHYGDPTFKQLREVIVKAVSTAAISQDFNFFTVVGDETCKDDWENCDGSFYINLDFGPEVIDDVDYEKLPQVRVENLATGRVIQEPVLPRGKISLYIPTRIFKALAIAKEINNKLESQTSKYQNWGIGLCGNTTTPCYPTENGIPISGSWENKLCFGDNRPSVLPYLKDYRAIIKITADGEEKKYETFEDLVGYMGDKVNKEIGKTSGLKKTLENPFSSFIRQVTARPSGPQGNNQTLYFQTQNNDFELTEFKVSPQIKAVKSVEVQQYEDGTKNWTYSGKCIRIASISVETKFLEYDDLHKVSKKNWEGQGITIKAIAPIDYPEKNGPYNITCISRAELGGSPLGGPSVSATCTQSSS